MAAMTRFITFLLLSSCALVPSARAQNRGIAPGQPDAGAATVSQWCSECHVTGQGQGGTDMAPPFGEIATTRTDEYVRGFLANPHGRRNMPPILLDPKEIENVIAYLGTMRAPGNEPGIPRR